MRSSSRLRPMRQVAVAAALVMLLLGVVGAILAALKRAMALVESAAA